MKNLSEEKSNASLLPAWMEFAADEPYSSGSGGRARRGFLAKNLGGLREAMADDLLTERYARQDYFLQRLEPRLKLILALALIVLVGMTRSITLLFTFWLFSILLMYWSRLPVLSLQKRIWAVFPLFSLIAAIPAIFSIFNPGTPLLVLYQTSKSLHCWGMDLPSYLYISRQGSMAALVLFLRVGISISFGVLLVISTPSARLFKSLRVLRVPVLFVMILEMSYRYLVLLINISLEMFEARNLRTVGRVPLGRQQWQVASTMGALFIKSMELSEEIYQAMTARGYTGEAVSMDESLC